MWCTKENKFKKSGISPPNLKKKIWRRLLVRIRRPLVPTNMWILCSKRTPGFPRQTFGGFSQISCSLSPCSPTFQHNKGAGKNPTYQYLAQSQCLGIGVLQYVCMCVAVEPVSSVFTTQFRGDFTQTSLLLKLESTKMTFPVLLFNTLWSHTQQSTLFRVKQQFHFMKLVKLPELIN